MKSNDEFIYKAFFRPNPPSVLRLACLQLIREGVDFTSKRNWKRTWNLIWDRAEYIVRVTNKTRIGRELHKELINERTF